MSSLQLVKEVSTPKGSGFHDNEAAAMLRAVINLFDRWELTDREARILLGDIGLRTYHRWKKRQPARIGVDLATRLSNLLGVHKALRLLFTEPQRGYKWVKKPNEAFAGKSALDVMLGGQITDLIRVRRYLDANRSH